MNQGQMLQQARRDPLGADEIRIWIETPEGVLIQRKTTRAALSAFNPDLAAELESGEMKATAQLEERIAALQSARAAINARRAPSAGSGGGRG